MEKLDNVHPGEILEKDFLEPLNLTAYALAKAIGVDQTRISQLIKGKRSITADTAIRFSKIFNMSPEFWLNAQSRYDLMQEMEHKENFENILPLATH
ncbi:MAG: HigA family addiction module antitoxin [Reichenbachiella sp.]|uniref:HigA family addiction module antitoxin n=1 Tax=Reichenbachiella sp. TaxID=2184521 RepID=UPI002966FE7E|nr:HigA family addiction module antitoxin [Reichenbachiella sp.]MDW3212233.1 HigA family addiction module antitoxin [Reichenbachiella sp.]